MLAAFLCLRLRIITSLSEYIGLSLEYNILMPIVMVEAFECAVCGWQWLPRSGEHREQCPNRECRSRAWNGQQRQKQGVIAPPEPQRPVSGHPTKPKTRNPAVTEASQPTDQAPSLTAAGCVSCGSIVSGLHQKGCKR
jgi:hypothetical protein